MNTATTARERASLIESETPAQAPPDRWRPLHDALAGIAQLKNDWDGDGAKSPGPDVIAAAKKLLELLERQPTVPAPCRIAAGPNGSIVLEWQHGLDYFEIEVDSGGTLAWMSAREKAPAQHGTDTQEAVLLLRSFAA